MTVLRVRKKETNFVVLDKSCLTQSDLSWGAKGLHSYLMSLPSDWCVNVYDLVNRATNGRDSVRGLLNELQKAGYISKEQIRDKVTGKFRCLEYIIHELPQSGESELFAEELPATGKASSVVPSTENPETDFTGTEYPATANLPLININNNKYTENKIIKAAAREESVLLQNAQQAKKAAAAFSDKKTQNTTSSVSFINSSAREDSVIGNELTPYQQGRVESLVSNVSALGYLVQAGEVSYCLLNPKSFKNSGQDFGRKLNAIRTIILRGEWQTPAELVIQENTHINEQESEKEQELFAIKAELHHFQRLLDLAKEGARENLALIVDRAKQKLHALERSYKVDVQ